MTQPATLAVMAALKNAGATARFVGGCVRDALFGRAVGDIDIATDAGPDVVIAALQAASLKAVPTGLAHGTITAVAHDEKGSCPFEITTLRHDVETDGRHARVAFTDDWAADAARRDFTMNALFLDPDGTLYDPCGGLKDAKAGRVRFVGEPAKRLDEDVLRLLRYFRFFAYYDHLPADPAALTACRAAAPRLTTLSGERVRQELLKLLAAPDPGAACALMANVEIFPHLFPEATALKRLMTLLALERRSGARRDPLLRLSALIEVGEVGAEQVAARLRLSNMEKNRLVALAVPELPIFGDLTSSMRNLILYRMGGPLTRDLALLAWAGETAKGEADDQAYMRLIAAADCWQPRVFPVRGDDALKLGLAGAAIGHALAAVEDLWIELGFAPDREACLGMLRKIAGASEF